MVVRVRRTLHDYRASDIFEVRINPPKKVVSIKMDVDLLNELDRLWKELGYKSRSQFILEAIIYYMQVVKEIKGRDERQKIDMEFVEEINSLLESAMDGEDFDYEEYRNVD